MSIKGIKLTAIALLLVVIVIVAFQNSETVETRLLFVTLAMPRALLLFTTLVAGVLIGIFVGTRMGKRDDPAE